MLTSGRLILKASGSCWEWPVCVAGQALQGSPENQAWRKHDASPPPLSGEPANPQGFTTSIQFFWDTTVCADKQIIQCLSL